MCVCVCMGVFLLLQWSETKATRSCAHYFAMELNSVVVVGPRNDFPRDLEVCIATSSSFRRLYLLVCFPFDSKWNKKTGKPERVLITKGIVAVVVAVVVNTAVTVTLLHLF